MKKSICILALAAMCTGTVWSQGRVTYKLDKMLASGQLEASPGHEITLLKDSSKKGITFTGIVWLPLKFNEGTVELDLRGRNEFLKSFLGIVFNTVDTATYEDILFRPFNFRHRDPVRRTWSLAYTVEPDFPYTKLRKESAGQFESEILPDPVPEDWIHARIVITKDSVQVYVNHIKKPSLSVKRLGGYHGDKLGLFVFGTGTPGDFANVSVKKDD